MAGWRLKGKTVFVVATLILILLLVAIRPHVVDQFKQDVPSLSSSVLTYTYGEDCVPCKHFDLVWGRFHKHYRDALHKANINSHRVKNSGKIKASDLPSVVLVTHTTSNGSTMTATSKFSWHEGQTFSALAMFINQSVHSFKP